MSDDRCSPEFSEAVASLRCPLSSCIAQGKTPQRHDGLRGMCKLLCLQPCSARVPAIDRHALDRCGLGMAESGNRISAAFAGRREAVPPFHCLRNRLECGNNSTAATARQVESTLARRPPMNTGKFSRRTLIQGASIVAAGTLRRPSWPKTQSRRSTGSSRRGGSTSRPAGGAMANSRWTSSAKPGPRWASRASTCSHPTTFRP